MVLSDATPRGSAPIVKTGVERRASGIAKGVMDKVVRF
jgi:hypothetical protein